MSNFESLEEAFETVFHDNFIDDPVTDESMDAFNQIINTVFPEENCDDR